MFSEGRESMEAGPATRQIERYYREKLDRRPGRSGPGASLLGQAFALN